MKEFKVGQEVILSAKGIECYRFDEYFDSLTEVGVVISVFNKNRRHPIEVKFGYDVNIFREQDLDIVISKEYSV
jgi:hypothetical protein